jgi:cobalamin biosynthesis protein CobW
MSALPSPPIDIVGGFLGAGKTTLLRRLLELGTGGERVAVVVNEFGEIGIDGMVVGGLGFAERMVELASGCICCQLDTVHFEVALDELCEEIRPDRVVIETSGVADPGALSHRLADLGRPLGSIVTVVDTVNLERVLAEPVGLAQVRAADFVVLSKLDLPETAGRERAEARIGEENARAVVVAGPVAREGLGLLFGSGLPAASSTPERRRAPTVRPAASSERRDAPGLESLSWRSARPLDRRATVEFLGALPPAVYRAKGVVRYADAAVPALVNVTAGRLQSQWEPALLDSTAGSSLVFIGRHLAGWRDGLLAALERCLAPVVSA